MAKTAGIRIEERSLNRNELSRASELFLTGTTSEVLPIATVDGQLVSDGRPGKVVRRLQELYGSAVQEFRARAV